MLQNYKNSYSTMSRTGVLLVAFGSIPYSVSCSNEIITRQRTLFQPNVQRQEERKPSSTRGVRFKEVVFLVFEQRQQPSTELSVKDTCWSCLELVSSLVGHWGSVVNLEQCTICSFLHKHVWAGHLSQLILSLDTLTGGIEQLGALLPWM